MTATTRPTRLKDKPPKPPANIYAERAVLGAALNAWARCASTVRDLPTESFFDPRHRAIQGAMLSLADAGATVEAGLLLAELERSRQIEAAGGYAYVSCLGEELPSPESVDDYAGNVLRCYRERLARRAVGGFLATTGGDIDSSVAALQNELARITALPATSARSTSISAVELASTEFPDVDFTLPGILPVGLSVLAARPKKGKSWLALGVGLAVASGGLALGQIPAAEGSALIVALEDNRRRLRQRLVTLAGAHPIPGKLHFVTELLRLDQGGLAWLENWITAHPDCRLVVLDTWARVKPLSRPKEDPYEAVTDTAGKLQRLAFAHNIAILLITHTKKEPAEDALDEVLGSTGLTGAADTVLVLRRKGGEADATLYVTGRDVEEQSIALRFRPDEGVWTLGGTAHEPASSPQRREVLDVLRSNASPMLPNQIASRLEKGGAAVRYLLARLLNEGMVTRDDGGGYSVTAHITRSPNNLYTTFTPHSPHTPCGTDAAPAEEVQGAVRSDSLRPSSCEELTSPHPERSVRGEREIGL